MMGRTWFIVNSTHSLYVKAHNLWGCENGIYAIHIILTKICIPVVALALIKGSSSNDTEVQPPIISPVIEFLLITLQKWSVQWMISCVSNYPLPGTWLHIPQIQDTTRIRWCWWWWDSITSVAIFQHAMSQRKQETHKNPSQSWQINCSKDDLSILAVVLLASVVLHGGSILKKHCQNQDPIRELCSMCYWYSADPLVCGVYSNTSCC